MMLNQLFMYSFFAFQQLIQMKKISILSSNTRQFSQIRKSIDCDNHNYEDMFSNPSLQKSHDNSIDNYRRNPKKISFSYHQVSQPTIIASNEKNRKRQSRRSGFANENDAIEIPDIHSQAKLIKREQIRRDIKRRNSKKKLLTIAKLSNLESGSQQINYEAYRIWRDAYMKQNEKYRRNRTLITQNSKQVSENQIACRDTIVYSHNKIKEIFGPYHNLFKVDHDYLRHNRTNPHFGLLLNQNLKQETQDLQTKNQNQTQNQAEAEEKKKLTKKSVNKMAVFEMANCPKLKLYKCIKSSEQAPICVYIKTRTHKKAITISASDQEIKVQGCERLIGESLKWVRICPEVANICNIYHSYNLVESIEISQILTGQQLFSDKQTIFVSFLKALYQIDSDLILRVFDTNFSTSYSLWLFVQGYFQKIQVNPHFAVNQQLNFVYAGHSCQLWLLILIKCICFLFNSMEYQILSKISPQYVYKLLTGLSLTKIGREQMLPLTTAEFKAYTMKQLQKGKICIMLKQTTNFQNNKQHQFYLLTRSIKEDKNRKQTDGSQTEVEKECSGIFAYSFSHDEIISVKAEDRVMSTIYVLSPHINMFIYCLQFVCLGLNQIQISCSADQQIIFSNSQVLIQKQKYLYIYEIMTSQASYNSKKTGNKLKLRANKALKGTLPIKFREGDYIVFVSDTKYRTLDILSQKHKIRHYTQEKMGYKICLMSTEEIQVKQGGIVFLKGSLAEDKDNIYNDLTHLSQLQFL